MPTQVMQAAVLRPVLRPVVQPVQGFGTAGPSELHRALVDSMPPHNTGPALPEASPDKPGELPSWWLCSARALPAAGLAPTQAAERCPSPVPEPRSRLSCAAGVPG